MARPSSVVTSDCIVTSVCAVFATAPVALGLPSGVYPLFAASADPNWGPTD